MAAKQGRKGAVQGQLEAAALAVLGALDGALEDGGEVARLREASEALLALAQALGSKAQPAPAKGPSPKTAPAKADKEAAPGGVIEIARVLKEGEDG